MEPIIEKLDNELIFDTEHIIMNYFKMNNFNLDCLKDTNIQISKNIIPINENPELISNSSKFSSNYFLALSKKENIIDLLSPIISNYPNSEIGLFLTIILNQHVIDISLNLNLSNELFQKYKNGVLSLYHNVLQKQKKSKLLENICASITVLIIIGFQGQWCNGVDQLISAAKENNGNTENNLIAALILSNVDNIYSKLKDKIENKSSNLILTLFDTYSYVINDYIKFLIQHSFSGEKENFVNGDLYKAFIGIILCSKYFKINVIQIHGFLEFIINNIFYIDINHDFIVQICELFDITFSLPNDKLKYNYNNFASNDFIHFIQEIPKNEDFQEIIKCIKLIENMKNFYMNKNIIDIKNNAKDIQILFASCNIFNSICENYGYIFLIPGLDNIIQEIYSYFINLPISEINKLLLSSLDDLFSLCQNNYKFENYDTNIRQEKMKQLNNFLYMIQNSVLEHMKLSNDVLNTFDININNKNLVLNSINLSKYIDEILKSNINDDEKIDLIENSEDFYNNIFDIIDNFFSGKDYCNKLMEFFKISTNNKDFSTIYGLMNIFKMLNFRIVNYYPNTFYDLIDFVFQNKEIFLVNKRFILQFIDLLHKIYIEIAKNIKYLNLVLENLINNNIIKSLNCDKTTEIIIILVNKLILTSYQTYKLNEDEDDYKSKLINDENKAALNNIFNLISNYLLDNLHILNHFYIYKIIDAFYNSLFFNIKLNINNKDSIFITTEKLFIEANQLYLKADNNSYKIIKYLFIIWSIIKNIGKENREALLYLLNNKNDPSYNTSLSYLANIQNNILNIINLNNKGNFNINLINSDILVCNTLISIFKEKIIDYFDYFNQIISLIISINPKYSKIYSLTYNLYTQIFTYNQNSEKYNMISQIGYDILNSINNIYDTIQGEDETVYLANKQLEFLILYIQKSPYFINNLNKDIFIQSINNIINIFDKTNHVEFSINYINFFKIISDISINNNVFENIIKNNFIEKIIKTIIGHIQYFNASYTRCMNNSFEIFKNCIKGGMEEKFAIALNDIYNDKEITEVIIKFVNFLKNNNSMKKNDVDKKMNEFVSDLNELFYAMNKKRNDFVKKYENEINNNNNDGEMRKYKVNLNLPIYNDLIPK